MTRKPLESAGVRFGVLSAFPGVMTRKPLESAGVRFGVLSAFPGVMTRKPLESAEARLRALSAPPGVMMRKVPVSDGDTIGMPPVSVTAGSARVAARASVRKEPLPVRWLGMPTAGACHCSAGTWASGVGQGPGAGGAGWETGTWAGSSAAIARCPVRWDSTSRALASLSWFLVLEAPGVGRCGVAAGSALGAPTGPADPAGSAAAGPAVNSGLGRAGSSRTTSISLCADGPAVSSSRDGPESSSWASRSAAMALTGRRGPVRSGIRSEGSAAGTLGPSFARAPSNHSRAMLSRPGSLRRGRLNSGTPREREPPLDARVAL